MNEITSSCLLCLMHKTVDLPDIRQRMRPTMMELMIPASVNKTGSTSVDEPTIVVTMDMVVWRLLAVPLGRCSSTSSSKKSSMYSWSWSWMDDMSFLQFSNINQANKNKGVDIFEDYNIHLVNSDYSGSKRPNSASKRNNINFAIDSTIAFVL